MGGDYKRIGLEDEGRFGGGFGQRGNLDTLWGLCYRSATAYKVVVVKQLDAVEPGC